MTGTNRTATARRLRLWLGLAVAAALPFAPGVTRAEGVTLSVAAACYVVGAWVFEVVAARRSRFPATALTAFLGLTVITVVIIAIPRTLEVGIVLFVLGVAFSTYVGGRTLGLCLSAGAAAAALVADALAPEARQVDGATLAVFVVLMPLLAIAVDRLTAEHRRTSGALARLHDVLGAVEAQPDLSATLESIAASIAHTINATVAGVILRDGDRFAVAARTSVASSLTPAEVEWLTEVELELSPAGPLGGMSGHAALFVADLERDPRMVNWSTPWARALRGLGCHTLVRAPLRLGGDVVGVIVAAFAPSDRPDQDDLAFLEAFAERASRVVVRASAYDRERVAALRLSEAAEEKTQFLGLVSHELRTPLTAVKGFVDTVLQHWDQLPEDRRRDLLDRASTNADELNRLVGQLLDFSRLDAEAVRLSPQPIVLSDVVEHVLEDLGPALEGHHVSVDLGGLTVLADRAALGRVLTSLLTNAAKFSPPDTRITVRAETAGDAVTASVADHGTGIPPEEQDRIFDRFYQATSNTLSRRGTGIGLSIAKRLAEMQGGRIRVESMPGVGSTFFVTMPAAPSRVEAEREEVAS
jgi:signal transduction histidine kinase